LKEPVCDLLAGKFLLVNRKPAPSRCWLFVEALQALLQTSDV